MSIRYSIYDGPEGPLLLAVDDAALVGWFRQLDEYFAGTRTAFDLPLQLHGTAFQVEVWEQLRRIPYGETISYGELAKRVDPSTREVAGVGRQHPTEDL